MEHKKQHWIPRSYLSAWCDPDCPAEQEPYVWVFPKEGGDGRRKAPANIFHETNMYTIERADGTRDLRLEKGLAGLESDFVTLRRDVLSKRVELAPADKLVVCAFVAATQARTRKQRDHFQEQWSGVLEDMDALKKAMAHKSPAERQQLSQLMSISSQPASRLGHGDVQRLAETPLQHMLPSIISTQVPMLYAMDLAILSVDDSLGFISSDAPCVWFDPEAYKRPFLYQAPGLAWPTIEVTLPVSPEQLVLISHSGRNGYYKVPVHIVDDINRRTRGHCDQHFVVNRNETRPIWYEWGSPPEEKESTDNVAG